MDASRNGRAAVTATAAVVPTVATIFPTVPTGFAVAMARSTVGAG